MPKRRETRVEKVINKIVKDLFGLDLPKGGKAPVVYRGNGGSFGSLSGGPRPPGKPGGG